MTLVMLWGGGGSLKVGLGGILATTFSILAPFGSSWSLFGPSQSTLSSNSVPLSFQVDVKCYFFHDLGLQNWPIWGKFWCRIHKKTMLTSHLFFEHVFDTFLFEFRIFLHLWNPLFSCSRAGASVFFKKSHYSMSTTNLTKETRFFSPKIHQKNDETSIRNRFWNLFEKVMRSGTDFFEISRLLEASWAPLG